MELFVLMFSQRPFKKVFVVMLLSIRLGSMCMFSQDFFRIHTFDTHIGIGFFQLIIFKFTCCLLLSYLLSFDFLEIGKWFQILVRVTGKVAGQYECFRKESEKLLDFLFLSRWTFVVLICLPSCNWKTCNLLLQTEC